MDRHIVVAVDGSEASTAAVEQAVFLARQRHMALTGIFIIDGNWPDYIGNDWQSAKGARQGFLDYIREEQETQANAAKDQFTKATGQVAGTTFKVLAGDPTDILIEFACNPETEILIFGKRVFQISGRPSLKALAVSVTKRATSPLLLLP